MKYPELYRKVMFTNLTIIRWGGDPNFKENIFTRD